MPAADPPPAGTPHDPELHGRAKDLFVAALRQPANERAGWVEDACAGDQLLRDDVLSLLTHHTEATLEAAVPTTTPLGPAAGGVTPGGHPPAPRWARAVPGPMRKQLEESTSPGHRRRLALGMALGAAVVIVGAVLVLRQVEVSLRGLLERQLVTLLDTGVVALHTWLDGELHLVSEFAGSARLTEQVALLVAAVDGTQDARQALDSESALEARETLASMLAPMARRGGHRGFAVIDREGRLLAFSAPERDVLDLLPGTRLRPDGIAELARTFDGEAWVRLPYRLGTFREAFAAPDDDTVLAVIAPVRDDEQRVFAALCFVLHAEDSFNVLLESSQVGKTGETYAFDNEGGMLSQSRHREELAAAGLLSRGPDGAPASSLHLPVRDPGRKLTAARARATGEAPVDAAGWPLTRMAADATEGGTGVDVDGYRDYRGVEVVGAWTWLDEYGFGLATEIDADEAYAPLAIPRAALAGLLVLLAASLGLAAASSLQVARLVRDVRRAQRLGQYTLEEMIGQGGSGQVWRAKHAMLQRPTAVKIVRPDALGPVALERFEREVQITARLTHPNTIEIYDYGRTEEGLFFYAMELLAGTSLQHLVTKHGAQPLPRVVHLLRQMCASLAEAHEAGLVHRDVKPGNAMLCRLGGQLDVLKLLDFGLVKDLEAPEVEATTSMHIAGTPLYMAPERLRPGSAVDARCDVWAVGATAYKLITGKDLWSGDVSDVFVKIMTSTAPRCLWHAPELPAAFDDLVAECLAIDPAERPPDARVLLARLEALDVPPWTQADARAWWEANPKD
ncbi:MAG: protein kinase domain-containing protein [Planctomycetota bacterium]|jgi:hypothetical protein